MGISEKSKVLRTGSRSTFITSARSLLGHSQDRQGPLPESAGDSPGATTGVTVRALPGRVQGPVPRSGRPLTSALRPLFTSGPGRVRERGQTWSDLSTDLFGPDVAVFRMDVAVCVADFPSCVAIGLENPGPGWSIIEYTLKPGKRCCYKL